MCQPMFTKTYSSVNSHKIYIFNVSMFGVVIVGEKLRDSISETGLLRHTRSYVLHWGSVERAPKLQLRILRTQSHYIHRKP